MARAAADGRPERRRAEAPGGGGRRPRAEAGGGPWRWRAWAPSRGGRRPRATASGGGSGRRRWKARRRRKGALAARRRSRGRIGLRLGGATMEEPWRGGTAAGRGMAAAATMKRSCRRGVPVRSGGGAAGRGMAAAATVKRSCRGIHAGGASPPSIPFLRVHSTATFVLTLDPVTGVTSGHPMEEVVAMPVLADTPLAG
nr:methyl-CpG-binding domain protein 2 isoform X2 [Aegilops tauschii subsp. strangulata]